MQQLVIDDEIDGVLRHGLFVQDGIEHHGVMRLVVMAEFAHGKGPTPYETGPAQAPLEIRRVDTVEGGGQVMMEAACLRHDAAQQLELRGNSLVGLTGRSIVNRLLTVAPLERRLGQRVQELSIEADHGRGQAYQNGIVVAADAVHPLHRPEMDQDRNGRSHRPGASGAKGRLGSLHGGAVVVEILLLREKREPPAHLPRRLPELFRPDIFCLDLVLDALAGGSDQVTDLLQS